MLLGQAHKCTSSIVASAQVRLQVLARNLAASSGKRMEAPPPNVITSHEAIINGDKLHWETAGNGAHNVLLLPGALGSTRTDFLPQLTKLDGSIFTIYVWDPPGYGKSRPPNRTWPDKFYTRDAESAVSLIKHIGLDQVSLVGWSDGGITALVMTVLYPELVDKLVIFGSNAYITELDMQLVENIRDLDKWSDRMRQPFEDVYGKECLQSTWNGWVDAYRRYLDEHDGDVVKNRVKEIKKPTLIIHGQKDALVPQSHPDFLHEQISNSKLVNWPEGKHNLHIRYADDFNQLVTEFLASNSQ